MSFFDRLFGRNKDNDRQPERRQLSEDEQAIERYRYMLRTAPPEQIEEAHAEAFERLTPEQREQVLRELSANVPANERASADDPRALARMATRAEVRQPGTLERVWGGMRSPGYGGGYGNAQGNMMGGFGGSFMSTMAGAFVGTAIANQLFGGWGGGWGGMDMGAGGAFGGDQGSDTGADASADVQDADTGGGFGSWGDGGGDAGGDFGDFGGGDF